MITFYLIIGRDTMYKGDPAPLPGLTGAISTLGGAAAGDEPPEKENDHRAQDGYQQRTKVE